MSVGCTQRPASPLSVRRRVGELEPRRDGATSRRLGVGAEALDASGPRVGPQVDPHAVELDASPAIARQRQAPAGCNCRHAAAPGRELDPVVPDKWSDDVDPDLTQDPEVLGRPPPGLVDVVDRDVLEVPRNRVEPEPPVGVPVGKPDAAARAEGSARERARDQRFQHRLVI